MPANAGTSLPHRVARRGALLQRTLPGSPALVTSYERATPAAPPWRRSAPGRAQGALLQTTWPGSPALMASWERATPATAVAPPLRRSAPGCAQGALLQPGSPALMAS